MLIFAAKIEKFMQLFYAPDINGEIYTLSEEESMHCLQVLRLRPGDDIHLTDGKGNLYGAVLEKAEKRSAQVRIREQHKDYGRRSYHLHIAMAPTKSIDRFEWFLEKATEIGIDEITPILCEHSERKLIKPERMERVIIAAMKQSVKTSKPVVHELGSYVDLVSRDHGDGQKFIAHCNDGKKPYLKDVLGNQGSYIILIGPEGDFSPEEVKKATDAGFIPVSLGESRLRTETAGIFACAVVNLAHT